MLNLASSASELGLSLSDRQSEAFETYYQMMTETNRVMNLTSITEWDDVVVKHFLDSLSVYAAVPEFRTALKKDTLPEGEEPSLIDVGTGAGFPGIPLKILFPSLSVTLLDSLQKRVNFLNSVIQALSLSDIQAVHARAEDLARNKSFRDAFDFAVSRAVASLPVLAEYCLPFVKPGGFFLAYKSDHAEEEINGARHAIHVLGGKIIRQEYVKLPESDIQRCFVVIQKVRPTPKAYPRKAGTAGKSPL